jgi:hypothetical protein
MIHSPVMLWWPLHYRLCAHKNTHKYRGSHDVYARPAATHRLIPNTSSHSPAVLRTHAYVPADQSNLPCARTVPRPLTAASLVPVSVRCLFNGAQCDMLTVVNRTSVRCVLNMYSAIRNRQLCLSASLGVCGD